ncbi:MAG: right-handed parallel beta-helix repeat-containing protein [Bacteroidales bacterium]|nr:MAG: right-handed parallel beta-helix repeat-containing protein [Bacteroidales bacterium]
MILRYRHLLFFLVCAGFLCLFNSKTGKAYEKEINTARSTEHDGKVKLDKKNPYGFTQLIYDFKAEEYFHISVWRQGNKENGVLVADGFNDPKFYHAQNQSSVIDSNGWELITLDIHIPPYHEFDELRIYAWNNGTESVYFRDLKIERLPQKIYPEFDQLSLQINTDREAMKKLENKRYTAFKYGVLETADDDYVRAQLVYGSDTLQANIRLKGDWLDHLAGSKWSFRVKMRKNDSWKNMRSFSIHIPSTRGFLDEWIAHKIFTSQDVLTTRYGLVPVILNGKSLGIYAYEEHFDKHLVESNNRREGPILKFTEEVLWTNQKLFYSDGKLYNVPYFDATDIVPFKKNRTVNNKILYDEFLIAQNLLHQFKNNLRPVSEIFDIKSLAKYYALSDITKAYHGFRWHNIRFYYNPVICRLEPVAFDYYHSKGIKYSPGIVIIGDLTKSHKIERLENMFMQPLRQKDFVNEYVYYLNIYSKKNFLDSIYNSLITEIDSLAELIRKEFKYYQYDISILRTNCKYISDYLETFKRKIKNPEHRARKTKKIKYGKKIHNELVPYLIKVHKNRYREDSLLYITSFYPEELQFTGYSDNKTILNYKTDNVGIPEESYNYPLKIASPDKAKFLFFKVEGRNRLFSVPVYKWNMPFDYSPLQELYDTFNIENRSETKKDGKTLIIEGKLDISEPLIIQGGYTVIIKQGTKLNFINKSTFISYSPVFVKGTKSQPVIITSSDGTAMGFSVFKAREKSILENVIIDQLNTIDYNGWTLTGAVNFYESDVDLLNVTFKNNRCEDALNIIRSEFSIVDCTFDNIFADAFDSDFSNGYIKNSQFRDIANDAVDFSGSNVTIDGCKIHNAGDKGISCGEKSVLTVNNVNINKTNIGIASKDLSRLTISNSLISNSNYSYVAFRKKPEYGEAEMRSINTTLKNITNGQIIEKGSVIQIDDEVIQGTYIKVAEKFYFN